jgi:outer membrane protein assembly factor BamD (BamD/ComL family)
MLRPCFAAVLAAAASACAESGQTKSAETKEEIRAMPAEAANQNREISTAVPMREPNPREVEALSTGTALADQAEAELTGARKGQGPERARALERFAERYPSHHSADDALVDAARTWARAGNNAAACATFSRSIAAYPVSDLLPDVLVELGECESRRGSNDLAKEHYRRVMSDFPTSPAARRARERVAQLDGRSEQKGAR